MKKIYIIFLITLPLIIFSQKENDNWYFGKQAAINFSTSTPLVLNNSQINSFEACGTVSDSINGSLLFYCTNSTIYNRDHQVMQNGSGILGGQSSEQLVIVKNPANVNQYFVFTTPEVVDPSNTPGSIRYSLVDMSLGNISNGSPLGVVLQNFKNIPVLDNLGNTFGTEAITAVASNIPNEYWVLIPNQNHLYSYRINSQGLSNGNPVISNLNYPSNLTSQSWFSIKASSKLNNSNFDNYICISNWQINGLGTTNFNKVLAFNSTSGTINNTYSLTVNTIQTYTPEFNQDGSVLFLGYKNIFAVDLVNSTNTNINVMQIYNDTSTFEHVSGLQKNKYGDIYISRYDSNFLGKINNPNVYGTNINVNLNDTYLGSNRFATHGLPQLVPYYQAPPSTYYPCIDNLILTFEPNINFNYEVGNNIITKDKYVLDSKHNINMKAGKSITLLPDTDIGKGANFYAFIALCDKEVENIMINNSQNQNEMVLNLDEENKHSSKASIGETLIENNIKIYPNPASRFIKIEVPGDDVLVSWEIYDMSGKLINKGMNAEINVENFAKTIYVLNIKTKKQSISKKIIVN